jgi:hypothetical protein
MGRRGGTQGESQQSTVNNQQSTINSQQSTVNNQQSTINSQQSTVNNQQSTINSQQSTVNNQQSTVNSQQSAATIKGRFAIFCFAQGLPEWWEGTGSAILRRSTGLPVYLFPCFLVYFSLSTTNGYELSKWGQVV